MEIIIEEIEPKYIIQIMTDNNNNFKGVGELIQHGYPHIFWTEYTAST